MFLRVLLFFIITILNTYLSISQELTQKISGKVIDATSKQPLIGATITIPNTKPLLGVITNINGEFELNNVPIGRQDIKVSFIGYQPIITRGALITSARAYTIIVEMEESLENLNEVLITPINAKRPLNKSAKVSARSFSIEEATRFAGGLGDPARVAYNFAGATFGSAQDNGIVIRGNSPTNVLWRIEGIEVPGASHFGGGNLAGAGLVTIFSPNVLGTSDFITGAFPAAYGNVTSGVFDINFRKGNNDETKYTGQLGILGVDLAIEGPLKKGSNSSYLVNYRHGFIGYYGRLVRGVSPDYQDLSFKLYIPTENSGNFSMWGMAGISSIFTPYKKYKVDKKDGEIKRRETERDFKQDDIDFDMMAIGVNHKIQLNKKSFLNSSIGITTSGYKSKTEWFEPDSEFLNTGTLTPYSNLENREIKYTLTTNLSNKFSKRIHTSTGITADYLSLKATARQVDNSKEPLKEYLNTKENSYYFQTYTQTDFQISPKFSAQLGVNVSHFSINKETTIEPRAGIQWKASPKLKFGLGYGSHSRREDLKVYYFKHLDKNGAIRNNKHIKKSKANHYVASVDLKINNSLHLNVEGYYQKLHDVPVAIDSSYSTANYTQLWKLDRALNNDGTGKNIGVDITLEKYFSNNYYYLLTASFFNSNYVGGDGIERNSLFNRSYSTTLTAGKEFTISNSKDIANYKKRTLGFNFNTTYLGGQRNTPFLESQSTAKQKVVLDHDRLYSLQNDPELWVNFGVTYKINKKKSTTTWGLDFQNATLATQNQGYEYNFFTNKVVDNDVLFLLPNFYYKIEF